MKTSGFWKKIVSMVLACAMLGTTFAQCAIAEENFETETVIEMEEVAPAGETMAEAAEVPESQDAAVEVPESQDAAAEVPESQDATAEVPESQDAAAEVPESQDATVEVPESQDATVEVPESQDATVEVPEDQDALKEAGDTATADAAEVPSDPDAAAQGSAEVSDVVVDEPLDDVEVEDEPVVMIDMIETLGGDSGIATIAVSGNFTYEDASDGGVRITGMNTAITGGGLSIPDTINGKNVTEIAANAFDNEAFNGTLTLPAYLTTIGESAFENCKFTGSLSLPSTITTIGKRAFAGCSFTGELTLPSNASVGESAFEGCSGFTGTLKIPAEMTSISTAAFKGCSGIKTLGFLGAVESIGASAFEGCSGLSGTLTIPGSVTAVGAGAFKNCAGFSAIGSFGVLTKIAASAFEGCTGLGGTLAITDKITEIGDGAFKNCTGIDCLDFSKSSALTKIGASAFQGCTDLKNGNVNYPAFAVPAGLLEIGNSAFSGCTGMTGKLNLSSLTKIGQYAFYGCTGFTSLVLPEELTSEMEIHAQAVYDNIYIDEAETPIEVQTGDLIDLPKVFAENKKLELLNQVKWSYQRKSGSAGLDNEDNSQNPNIPNWVAVGSGTVTITATAYNGKTSTKTVVITPTSSTTDTIAPIVKSISGGGAVGKPGSLDLSMTFVEMNSGIVALNGYFYKVDDQGQKISFSANWEKERKFSEEVSDISVDVPASTADGVYYLGSLTLKDGAGNETSYTYDLGTGKWKNGKGNIVAIDTSELDRIRVYDRFDRASYATSIYITGAEPYFSKSYAGKGLVITYDASNHKVLKGWMQQAKDNAISLLLSNGTTEWSILGTDIGAVSADFDCLVTVGGLDAARYGNSDPVMTVNFAGISALPGEAMVRIRADQMNGLYDQTNAIYVYSMNANETLTEQEIQVSYLQSGGQYWYEFEVSNATPSQLIMSGKKLSLKPANKVTSIKLNKKTLGLVKGKTYTLKATVGPSYAKNKKVKWKSSNTSVATVNKNGKITAKKYGKVTITATAKDGSGVVAKCKLTVGYRIKYKLNNGKNNKNNPKVYYKTGIVLKNPTRKGYKFKGWYTDKYFRNRIKKIPKSYKRNLTLYAKWQKK